jgi:hypothetical protein
MANENEGQNASADPVLAWLEEIRDFEGSTDRAREMSKAAIGRLTATPTAAAAPVQEAAAPATTTDTKIDRIVQAAREETERGRKERRQ